MVDKQEFVKLADNFVKYNNMWYSAADILGENSGDGFVDNLLSLTSDCLAAATDNITINPLFDDDDTFAEMGYDCPIVIWWIYMAGCGETEDNVTINGRKFDVSTAANLYDAIDYARQLSEPEAEDCIS